MRPLVERALEPLADNAELAAALDAAPSEIRASLPLVFACSDFVSQCCARNPGLLIELLESGDLRRRLRRPEFIAHAPAITTEVQASPVPEAEFIASLRRWRKREMVRIAWRDLAGWASLEETLSELSVFADSAIQVAQEHARHALVARYGEPRSPSGEVQQLVVVGMGKLGGGELNFSSDVDLVFLFPEHGETDGARPIENE